MTKAVLPALGFLGLILLLHLFRYEVQPLPMGQSTGVAYVESDRWLGRSRICSPTTCQPWR